MARTVGATRHLEIETKLEIDTGRSLDDLITGKVRDAGMVAVADPVRHELDAVYFDTDGHHLLAAKLTLRRRTGGTDAGWHLKLPSVEGARTEIGLPLQDGDERRVPSALADLVSGAARGLPLRPVARIRNDRTVRHLLDADGTALVEIADDTVTATAIDAAGHEGEPAGWRELEAEVLGGDRGHLAAAVTMLTKKGARPASSASKLARALADTGVVVPAAPPRKKDRSAGTAVLTAVRRQLAVLIAADRALREKVPGALHDGRAATRRLRSLLGVFGRVFEECGAGSDVARLRDELAEHSAILGAARDVEVVRGRLETQLIDEPAEYAGAARVRLEEEYARRMPAALAQVSVRLHSAAYFAMLRSLDALVDGPVLSARAAKSAESELPAMIAVAWERLGTLADRAQADPENPEAVHVVRRRARALRYATECVAGALGEPAELFAAALEEIQEVLGEYQDAVTAAELLADLSLAHDTDGTAGFVFGRLHAFEQAVAHGTLEDFADAWDRVEDAALPVLPQRS
ncbi:CHAD domain-containing protein [Nakamurella sp. YIM 132087]|uniref:CHAD domain-containing protein n=1 Tax=Nakamurella alba TaxID=2665158 RepID=A0A7K1FRD8_9ACTN|nr:CYTH and CHAD domain-containing protein [Nakamurella alba]MTD15929.1 CHAD domain-containing protein [Nakamurella alba]